MYLIVKRQKGSYVVTASARPALHQTIEDAEIEASRLARLDNESEFIIMSPLSIARSTEAPTEIVPFVQPIVIK